RNPVNTPVAAAPPREPAQPFGRPGSPATRRLRRAAFGLALAAAAGVAFWATRDKAPQEGAGHAHGAAATAGEAMPVTLGPREQARIGITFAPVLRAPLDRTVRTVAQVSYDETRVKTVAPLIDGWVDRLFVNFTGQSVRPGDPLFSIYSPMVVTAQQELLLARRLVHDLSAGTPEAARSANDLLESARRRLQYWGVPQQEVQRLETTGEVRRTITLRSPYAGVVVDKPVLAGQRIMAGEVAYKIADLSRVWLEGEVFERDLSAVRLGRPVTAEFTALPGVVREGRMTYVYPTVNPDTRTARIRVELRNPGLQLKPGMYATIRFEAPTDSILSVPRSAVLATGERNLVFVRGPDGRLSPHLVTLGAATDDRVEIMRGLSLGDTVVASGTFLLDAESNLGSLLGGMGNMPGMDVTAPAGPDKE
ncbi:MAG TPA: efflux RND transporter periplasmic adaptor subunit, partial [Gemmatimonadales bacterium]|nr:efflux RND transporter periplasmic adaptor subunit [Gemmatimonadales bacterium]